jgi:hypothetical protein
VERPATTKELSYLPTMSHGRITDPLFPLLAPVRLLLFKYGPELEPLGRHWHREQGIPRFDRQRNRHCSSAAE